jgi:ABC-2 type transport system ATP-binding protein
MSDTNAASARAPAASSAMAGLSTSSAIRMEGLTKYYGSIVGVEDVSLDVRQGEVFGFLGANGAGKTTTIRLLLDLLRPTQGRASIFGFDCQREGLAARACVGYLPGELPIMPDLTGAGLLKFLSRVGGQTVSSTRLAWLLRRFDVSDMDLRRKLRDQSQGMRRKLGVIQAMMTGAPVIILDEPTLGLDPLMIDAFCETVQDLVRDGTTVFLSSHVLAEVDRVCDRVALIRRGRLVEVQDLADLRRHAARRIIVELTRPVEPFGYWPPSVLIVACEPRRWVLDVRGPLGPLLVQLRDLPIADLHVQPFTLQDYVLEHYADDDSHA